MATKDDSKPVDDGAHLFANNADQSDPFQALSSNNTQTARESHTETAAQPAEQPGEPVANPKPPGPSTEGQVENNKTVAGDASTLFGGAAADDSGVDALFGGGHSSVSGADTLFSQQRPEQQPAADSLFAQAQPASDPFFNGQYDNAAYQQPYTADAQQQQQQHAPYAPQQSDPSQSYSQYSAQPSDQPDQQQHYAQYAPQQYAQEQYTQYTPQQAATGTQQYAEYAQQPAHDQYSQYEAIPEQQQQQQQQEQQQQQQGYSQYDAYGSYQYQDAYNNTYQQAPNYDQQASSTAAYAGYDPQQYAQHEQYANYQYAGQQTSTADQYTYDPQSAYQQQPSQVASDQMATAGGQYAYDPQQAYQQQPYDPQQAYQQQQQQLQAADQTSGVAQTGQDTQGIYQPQQEQPQPTAVEAGSNFYGYDAQQEAQQVPEIQPAATTEAPAEAPAQAPAPTATDSFAYGAEHSYQAAQETAPQPSVPEQHPAAAPAGDQEVPAILQPQEEEVDASSQRHAPYEEIQPADKLPVKAEQFKNVQDVVDGAQESNVDLGASAYGADQQQMRSGAYAQGEGGIKDTSAGVVNTVEQQTTEQNAYDLQSHESQPEGAGGYAQDGTTDATVGVFNPVDQQTAQQHTYEAADVAGFDQHAYQPQQHAAQEQPSDQHAYEPHDGSIGAQQPAEQYTTYEQQPGQQTMYDVGPSETAYNVQDKQVDGVYYQEQQQSAEAEQYGHYDQYRYSTEQNGFEEIGASEVQSSQQEQEAQFDTGVALHAGSEMDGAVLQEISEEQVVPATLGQSYDPYAYHAPPAGSVAAPPVTATAKPDDVHPSREPVPLQRSSMEQNGRVSMERTNTVYSAGSGSMLNRLASPQLEQLLPCPDPNCDGENKAKAKFCCECGRPLASISRTTTPAAGSISSAVISAEQPVHPPTSYDSAYGPPTTQAQQQPPQLHQQPGMYAPEQSYASEPATLMMGEAGVDDTQAYYQNEASAAAATPDMYAQQQQLPPDPLNRARGCPLINFGFGGKLCVMFPQTVQRFTTGYDSGAPITKTMPSVIQIRKLKDVLGEQDAMVRSLSDFVGPVLMDSKMGAKSKKKDALAYMDKRIAELTAALPSPDLPMELNRAESRVLLWRLVRSMMEEDGTVGEGGKADEAIRALLQPTDMDTNDDQGDFSVPAYAQSNAGACDENAENEERSKKVLTKLEAFLIKGDRAGAVDYAMQEDLWAHALILSSCVDKELWKKVVTNFVERDLSASAENAPRQDRFNVRGDKQSLRVLYSLFAGSGVASVSEFIQAGAPAHLMNTPFASSQPAHQRGDEEQLYEWRITLALILANRTPRDTEAITALGDVLRNHGWLDAAHICYLVSPQTSVHSGVDAPHVRMTLVGADGPNAFHNLDAYLLSELFEFALSTKQGGVTSLPFLQSYKLVHAWWLADLGFVHVAQRYCEAIAGAVKGYTKGSPYLHRQLLESTREFSELCEVTSGHSIGGDTGSWLKNKLSKNSLDSLWGSLEGKFNKFVSGEDIPAEEPPARKSTEIMARPYDAIMDGPPARSASAFDFRNGRTSVGPEGTRRAATPTATMPSEGYSRRSSSPGARAGGGPFTHGFTPISQYAHPAGVQQQQQQQQQQPEPTESAAQEDAMQSGYGGYSGYGYGAPPMNAAMSPFGRGEATPQYSPTTMAQPTMYDSQQQAGFEQNGWYGQQSYEPSPEQQASAYASTPSYEPSSVTTPQEHATSGYVDNDDDLGFGNTSLTKNKTPSPSRPTSAAANENEHQTSEKTQQEPQERNEEEDKKADEGKGGWRLFSLFSRSSTPASTPADEKKAVKANLGEQSTFYYDEKEKRWVNKAAPSPASTPALPPPPKASKPSTPAPPSAASTPPPPSSGAGASPALSTMSGPPGGPPGGGPPGGPRSATSPPPSGGANRRAGGRKPMRSRYVDVFNQSGN